MEPTIGKQIIVYWETLFRPGVLMLNVLDEMRSIAALKQKILRKCIIGIDSKLSYHYNI